MFIWNLLTELTSPRRRCRMCGAGVTGRTRYCRADCRRDYLDFFSPGS